LVHIEKISMRGFKSFGNKRVGIPIDKGFTAIVGPNGSGKSNVVDAICFVLGRMSTKSMRAERLTDLIWAGNDKFPEGSYAEVSLHLNNADRKLPLDEPKIIVSRRVDRSGRSVYRANKKRMTRNEIVDTLAMAHIFPEGYNIVLQGDITKLVKMTSTERRMLIDELSGISEYDLKKEKAMRELSKAEENIRATNLVIDEVLSQLRRLERERDEAVRYQDLISQIRELKWQYQHNQLRKHRERYAAILEKTQKGQERIEEIEKQIEDINSQIETKQEKQEALERTIEKRQEIDQERLGKQVEEVRAQIVRAQENMKNTRDNLDKQEKQAESVKSSIKADREKMKENRNRIQVLRGQREKLSASLESLRSEKESLEKQITSLESESSKVREDFEDLESRLAELRKKEREAREQLSQNTISVNRAQEEITYISRSANEETGRIDELKRRRDERKVQIEAMTRTMGEIEGKIDEIRIDLEAHSQRLSEVEEDLEEKSSRKTRMEAFLKAAKESENPQKRAISHLMERKNEAEEFGILGVVSQLIDVPDELKKPISAALGRWSQCLVVRDRGAAQRCIDYLRENEIGWASFIPLKELERVNNRADSDSISGKGIVGFPLNLVGYEEEIRPLMEFIFGRMVITEDVECSNSLPRNLLTVTREGELMDPSGIVTGGYRPTNGDFDLMLDFTQDDVSTISEEVKNLQSEKRQLAAELEDLRGGLMDARRGHAEGNANLEAARKEVEELSEQISDLETHISDLSEKRAAAAEALEAANSKAEEMKAAADQASGQLSEVESRRDELLQEIEDPEIKRLDRRLRDVRSQISQIVDKDSQLRSDIVALERETEYLEESIERHQQELREAEKGAEGLRVVLEKISGDTPKLEQELEELKNSQDDIREQIKQLRTRVFAEKSDLSDLVRKRDALSEDKNRLSVEINSSVYERSQLDLEIHKLEHEMSLVDYEYEPVELDDLEEISKRISALEIEKSRLEPVNMRAIDSYEETEDKFNEYKERRDKVMEEREAILQFMSEIEAKKKQVFMNAFENIAENFQRIFAKLSPGGEGKLVLEDYEDPFAGGLMIEAKPAGKEVNVIDSMSGGEKALTALAFIFAIQAYKPSPFYILDEIDAHLDDENVKRVAELVAETARDSQFIVVTLRDSMMAQADELLGVSMEEGDVSKVVGVRMEAGELVERAAEAEVEAGGAQA
jgi:chromosome segregation protein